MGEKIRQAREKAGMSQHELARALGISSTAISFWESGKTAPTVGNLYRLASILGVEPGDLL